ncbi:MAG: radical SAM protein [Candidatus Fermentibacter sp.]|nr:radical SAM protein [Candidatus Fermentibacter sp.]
MRVALLQNRWRDRESPVYPLGLASLAAVLRDRHEVRCLDESMDPSGGGRILDEIVSWRPDVIGLGMRNSDALSYPDIINGDVRDAFSPLVRLRETARTLRAALPGVVLVAGGAAFTIFARRVMDVAEDLDFGIVGEAESSLPALLEDLSHPELVPGVAFRRDGRTVMPASVATADFGRLPRPDRDIMDVRPYIALGNPWTVGVQTRRGCLMNCAYCVYPRINGPGVRTREPGDIVDEIEALVRDYGLERFQFADSVFNCPQDHAAEVCRQIIRRGIDVEWSAWFDLKPLDEEFARLAVEAGCRLFELSPDGYTDRTLAGLGKDISRNDIVRTCRMLARVPGARASFNFIYSAPGETLTSALRLLSFRFLLRIRSRGRFSTGPLNMIRMHPGTPIHQMALREGLIDGDAELLPLDPADILRTYYRPKPMGAVERLYIALIRLGSLKRRLFPSRAG